ENDRQVEGAMRELRSLDASLFAVQEITDPARFEREARRALGEEWRFVAIEEGTHRTGVLFDGDALELEWSRMHRATRIDGRGKPTLEVRLRREARSLRVFVAHLKAGGEHAPLRRRQMQALAPIVRDAVESGDEVMVLGDFNATGDEDRASLARFGQEASLTWASRELGCTSYWNRNDGCLGVALDHVFTAATPRDVSARGPCEREGCAMRDRCPAFHREVSDHCPVSVDF
ncbi:MAG: endonuclease/exonuclease/phosphatase family protein, partial [Sandaracinaceae bacterium]|nr:endonuclease/exonuclease/phosphatase family protein [Sandaracinaceae bacterium]